METNQKHVLNILAYKIYLKVFYILQKINGILRREFYRLEYLS